MSNILYEFAEKVNKLEASGRKIIKLNLGEQNQPTPKIVVKAAIQSLKAGETSYGPGLGEKYLREKIAEIHKTSSEKVAVTTGSKISIYSLMKIILGTGDNVIVPSPHWPAYKLIAENIGAEIRFLKTDFENKWDVDVQKLESLIDSRTKMIILTNPNNPTSTMMNPKTLNEIVSLAERKGIYILYDNAYMGLAFNKPDKLSSENVFCVETFSKAYAMTGWRVGYTICKKEIAEKMLRFNQITTSCVPKFVQRAAYAALENKEKIQKKMANISKKRSAFASDILKKNNFEFVKPQAGFYVFPNVRVDGLQFTEKLLERSIAVVPGAAFGDYNDFVRISLTEDILVLEKVFEEINNTVNDLK